MIHIQYWYNMSRSACLMAVAGGAGCQVLPWPRPASRWCDVHDDQTQTTRKCAAQSRAYKLETVDIRVRVIWQLFLIFEN